MTIESFTFDKGVNRKKSPLLLEEGELYDCRGFSYAHDGVLETREPKNVKEAIDTTATSTINGIHRYNDSILASSKALCPGSQAYFNYIYQRTLTGSFSNIDLMGGSLRPRFADYELFTFAVDGASRRAYVGANDYKWGVDNPVKGPTLTVGAGGNPDGDYSCYVTFYIKFPNDKYVETGPSTASEITVSSTKIEWSNIPICQYEGAGLVIHRRLYRTVSGTAYLVTTIPDNVTESYSDNETDATLQAATVMGTEGYSTPPDYPTDVAIYLQRAFVIKDNKLYWSEAYAPFSFKTTSNITVTKEDEDLEGIVDWGDQLYIVSAERWYRLQGNDPDTWLIRRTFTDVGIINRATLKRSKYGLLGLWNDGVYLFDGSINKNITEKKLGAKFFTSLDDLSVCYAEFDGTKYYLYYASSGTTVDKCLVIDFTYYPEYRITFDDFIATAHELYKEENHRYLAYAGSEYEETGSETIATYLKTGDRGFGNIIKRKALNYLYYDIDTSDVDVTANIYCDGTLAQTLTLNTSSRTRKRSMPLKVIEGYRFSLELECADSEDVSIYSPWVLEATPVGE